jgi:uncharacterized oxidoreductase
VGTTVHLQAPRLKKLLADLFTAYGCSAAEAVAVGEHLVEADMRGHPSHGVGLVPIYVSNLANGEVVANQVVQRVPLDSDFMLFDGQRGFGQSVGIQVVKEIIARTAANGSAIFGLRNVHHLGRIGDYGERLAGAGIASVMFVNTVSRPIVAPYGGSEARMGTNPVCITIPRPASAPVVLDFATSAMAVGKCRVAIENEQNVPPGHLLDAAGNPTTDPRVLYEQPQGALLAMGGHKGSGLNLICELLSASISGLTMPDARPKSGSAINNLVGMAFRVPVVPEADEHLEAALEYFVTTRPGPDVQAVLLPGDPETRTYEQHASAGIPLASESWEKIVRIGTQAGLAREDMEAAQID